MNKLARNQDINHMLPQNPIAINRTIFPRLWVLIKSPAFLLVFLIFSSCTTTEFDSLETIFHPQAGEICYAGGQLKIHWAIDNTDFVNINLIVNNGTPIEIKSQLKNLRSYTWNVPDTLPPGNEYTISISSTLDQNKTITSKAPFEIRNPGTQSSFTDERDGTVYKTIELGNQVWMAENFNYDTEGGDYFYHNNEAYAEEYGRLYSQDAAIKNCPKGWHLPSDDEWKELEMYLGLSKNDADILGNRGIGIETLLFKESGSGFDTMFGGYYNSCFDRSGHLPWEASFWTSSVNREGNPIVRIFGVLREGIIRQASICHEGCSVRYIKNKVEN